MTHTCQKYKCGDFFNGDKNVQSIIDAALPENTKTDLTQFLYK